MSVIQISAKDAFALLKNESRSILIDVRTQEEFTFVGLADLRDAENRLALLPWKLLPDMRQNPEFTNSLIKILKEAFGENAFDAKLIFLCRSGSRSDQAANHATTIGFDNCYNIISGFEGDINDEGHRGYTNGWKADQLPWRQS
jgi:rhodanese-related sulfurtransferase